MVVVESNGLLVNQTALIDLLRCKGTKKNVYVQEKYTFLAIGYIFCVATFSDICNIQHIFLGVYIPVDTMCYCPCRARKLIGAKVVEKIMLFMLLIYIILVVWGCGV